MCITLWDLRGLRVLRELASAVAKPVSMLFEKLWQPGEDSYWKKENIVPVFEGGRKEDPWNHRPVSLTSVHGNRGSWNRSSWKSMPRHMENKEEIQDNHHNLTKGEVLHG